MATRSFSNRQAQVYEVSSKVRRALTMARNHNFGPAWELMHEAYELLEGGGNEKRYAREQFDRAIPIIEGLERAYDRRRG